MSLPLTPTQTVGPYLSLGLPWVGARGRSLGSKSGSDAIEITSPVCTSMRTAAAPLAFISFMPPSSTRSVAACTVRSSDSSSGAPSRAGLRNSSSKNRSIPAVPITSAECTPSRPKLDPPSTCAASDPLG